MSKQRADCRAYQASDQMFCRSCSLVWDVNDPEPPTCKLSVNDDRTAQEDVEHRAPTLKQRRKTWNTFKRHG